MKRILHHWSDSDAAKILGVIRAAMSPDAKLLIMEYVLPPPNIRSFGYLLDLHMMTILGGIERRASEFDELLASSGFRMNRVLITKSELSIIEASLV